VGPTTLFYILFIPVFGLVALATAIVSFLITVSLTINEPTDVEQGGADG
jgi:hypothetical protein